MWNNLRWGIRWGLIFGAVYICWAVFLYIARGSAAFSSNGTTLGAVVASYVVGALGAGGVVGLMRPLSRSKFGSAVIGMVAIVPIFLGIRLADKGFGGWGYADAFVVAGMAIFGGGLAGMILREIFLDP